MILRLSANLATKVKAKVTTVLPLDANPLADWSLRLFKFERWQFILATNSATLYSAVFAARGSTDVKALANRVGLGIWEVMTADGIQPADDHFIAPSFETVRFAKALNRAVTGSMNDLIHLAQVYLRRQTPVEASLHINLAPMSAIGMESPRRTMRNQMGLPDDRPNRP